MEELTQLAALELTDSEVHEILTRLGAQEFGTKSGATIADVCECTGTSPEVIGRIVADIRAENLTDRFGAQIQTHAERIEELDHKVKQIPTQVESGALSPEVTEELRFLAENRIATRRFLPFLLILGMTMVIVFGVALTNKNARRPTPNSVHFLKLASGRKVFMDDVTKETWVIEPNGDRRATEGEEENDAVYRLYRGWADGTE